MNKENQNNNIQNYSEEKSKDSNSSSSNENKATKINISIMKFKLIKCFKKYVNIIFNEISRFFSKLSILSQYLFILIPSSIFLLLLLLFLHYHAFETVLKFDFYCAIKDEYLKPIITDLDNIHFDISSLEAKNTYEDLEGLFFFKIYFKELMSMGLLNESSNNKIYPGIADTSETIYYSLDEFQKSIKMNSYFKIPKNDSEKYIDQRNDSFSELGKLYYYMFPTISFEGFNRDIYINQSFLIAYEFDKNNGKIKNDYFYFSFPKSDNDAVKSNNFIADNSYIWPKISEEKVIHGEKYNDSFYKENWFAKQEYDFRINTNENHNVKFTASQLNYNYYGKLNKTNIFALQNYETSNGKNYIINLIFFINERIIKEESFHYSTFLIFNDTNPMNIKEKERYSDNTTYLIFKSNILELSLSSTLYKYFHFGIYDKNNNFFKYGASFDGFDFEQFAEPLKYYNTIKNFNIDLRYFSSLYLYTLLFIKADYNISVNEKTEMNQFDFYDKNNITETICGNFNYSSYKEYLLSENIDCWDIQNIFYYSKEGIEKDKALHNYISMPYCICLPLYCLKNNLKNFSQNDIAFKENISLPERCQNNLKYFQKYNENENKNKILQYGEKVNIFSKNLKTKLEDEFYTYKYMKYSYIPGIYFLVINLVDNSILNNLLGIFLDNLTIYQFYFFVLITISFFILVLIAINILIHNIKKVSGVIFEFQKKHEYYLYQLKVDNDSNLEKNNEKENYNNINKNDNIFNYSENKPLLQNEEENYEDNVNNDIYNNLNENPLIDDLFKIYYKYYNITENDLMKQNINPVKTIKLKAKLNIIEEKNELFKLLSILSLYSPKFKLNASIDYNCYINTKLNQNFLKFIKKNKFISAQQTQLTQSVIYELLSTENVEDYGIEPNINFKYITNINLKGKNNNSIKKAIFRYDDSEDKEIKENNSLNKNKIVFKEEVNKNNTKIMYKLRNNLLNDLENNFENDDFLKKEKLQSSFDFFLLNVHYKYLKKIISTSESPQLQENLD